MIHVDDFQPEIIYNEGYIEYEFEEGVEEEDDSE